MLPSLTATARRVPRRRLLAGAASVVLLACVLLGQGMTAGAPGTAAPSLAEQLPPSSWALAIPMSWFAAPPAELRPGDRIDIVALRSSERPSANAIAFDLIVMAADERSLVVGLSAFDASAIAVARASGQLIVPLLRSAR
ncbi:MAG TPA: hypothetical protein VFW12_01595 [Candidatus Limnocylindria bacterium]|nr:hypothetical protein [Candidatus Limnocylindria bacterium]